MKKYDIFISYSHADKAFAEKVCAVLDRYKAEHKFEYFFDTEGLTSREEYLKRIAGTILESKSVIFIASKNSYASEFCSKELLWADKHKIHIHQYRIDNAAIPIDIDMLLGTHQYRELKSTPIEKMVEEVLCNEGIIQRADEQIPPPPMPPVVKEILNLTIWGAASAMLLSLVALGPGVGAFIYAILAHKQWGKNNSELMFNYVRKARRWMMATFIVQVSVIATALLVLSLVLNS